MLLSCERGTASVSREIYKLTLNMPIADEYDVVVCGGGAAGCAAAIQAAREGARTALIEKNGILGGTTVVAAVNFPGLFHTRSGRQVIKGIGWEFIAETAARGGAELPDFTIPYPPKHHPRHQIWVNKFIYSKVLDDLCLAAGVHLRFHEMPVNIHEDSEGLYMTVAGKTGLETIKARKIIDATGDANAAGLMGYAMERSEHRQPGTLIYRMGGYDPKDVDKRALERLYAEAFASGRIAATDHSHPEPGDPPLWRELRTGGGNANHLIGIEGDSSRTKTEADLQGRAVVMNVYRLLRKVPGCEHLEIDYAANESGIRDTNRIIGEERITGEAYTGGYVWPDAVCYSYYPIDIHRHDGNDIDIRPLADGIVATIPYGALIPKGSKHALVAGRCIAGDAEAHSAYRVQASCMATGQVAGAAAAIASKSRIAVGDVDLRELRETLGRHDAIVPRTPTGC